MKKKEGDDVFRWIALGAVGGCVLLFTASQVVTAVSNHGKALADFGLHIEEKRNKTNQRFEKIELELKRIKQETRYINNDITDTREQAGIEWPLDRPVGWREWQEVD